MALSTVGWIIVILALAWLIARAAGNFYDDYIGNAVPPDWPGATKFWWRRLRYRCQLCGGPLKARVSKTPPIIRETKGRKYRVCGWCVDMARKGQQYAREDAERQAQRHVH